MPASCSRSRRNDVSLTVTSSISRATSGARWSGSSRRRRNASGLRAGADAIERALEEVVLLLAEPDAALLADERGQPGERARS